MRNTLLSEKILALHLFGICALTNVSAQAQEAVPAALGAPPRTITAKLAAKKPERVVDLYWHDEARRVCVDTYKLEAGRAEIRVGESVSFRVRIQRRCDDKSQKAPVPIKAVFSVRAVGSRKSEPDFVETSEPSSSAFSFAYTFTKAGSWQVSVVSHLSPDETHTVSFVVQVMAAEL